MVKTALPIADGFYVSRSLPIAAQQCVNWYPVVNQGPALSPQSLFGCPGLEQLQTSGTLKNVNRGAHVKNGVPYFVNGEVLYSLTVAAGVYTLNNLGAIPGTGRVSMADNGTQLMVLIPGGNGYIYNEDDGSPFQQITDPDFTANGNPQHVVFMNGYFVLSTDTKKFIISALNDGLAYDALDFGSAEVDPDDIVALLPHKGQLFIFGSETIEVFQNVPQGAGFPFQRVEGFVLSRGLFGQFSIVEANETFMFIGGGVNESPSIWAFTGNDLAPISTDGIDAILEQFTQAEIEQSFAWSYSQAGARFVGFSLPTTSLVFDFTSQKWHERRSQIVDPNGTRDVRWRANSLVTAYGLVLVGDSQDGRVGQVDLDLYEEYGANIIREVVTVPFSNNGNAVMVSSLEITMEAGVGDLTTNDPQIRMARSKDARTWGNELSRSIGKLGEYSKRAIFRRLGRAGRFELFRFTFSDKVKPVIIQLVGDISGGSK